jgi:Uma2 family endonuclease
MSLRKHEVTATSDYPESDGEPMAETDVHIQLMIDLRLTLKTFFRAAPDVYIASNLFIYYAEGDLGKRVAPDVFVVRGVNREPRRIYKLWEEGCAPQVVIELSSRKTWREDLYTKWQMYARLGVREYFIFDPEYDYLPEPLVGWRLADEQYLPIEVTDGRARSEELGLELVDTGQTLRLYNPQTEQFLPTSQEETERAERLAAKLRDMGIDPEHV